MQRNSKQLKPQHDDSDNDSPIESEYNGDSDYNGSEVEIHDSCTQFEGKDPTIDNICGVELVPAEGDYSSILGVPKGWVPPGPLLDHLYKPKKGDPLAEEELDNPGNWNLLSFTAKHVGSTKWYEGHFTPANAKVVTPDSSGNHKTKYWMFFYKGWL